MVNLLTVLFQAFGWVSEDYFLNLMGIIYSAPTLSPTTYAQENYPEATYGSNAQADYQSVHFSDNFFTSFGPFGYYKLFTWNGWFSYQIDTLYLLPTYVFVPWILMLNLGRVFMGRLTI